MSSRESMATLQSVDARSERVDVAGDAPAFVAPGRYEFKYLHDETKSLVNGRSLKLCIWFQIITPGEHMGVKLPRYYNVQGLKGKPSRYGGFKVGWRSEFMREYATLFGLPSRRDRIAMSRFDNCVIAGRVRTVRHTWKQKPIPEALYYSVIDELLSVQAGGSGPTVTPRPTPIPTPTRELGRSSTGAG